MSNAHYWINKNERAKVAKNHADNMKKNYSREIEDSIQRTQIHGFVKNYATHDKCKSRIEKMDIRVEDFDSVSAIMKYASGKEKCAVLNFSSYKNPGGMFLKGSKAQEECLCHESILYNVLSAHQSFYDWNNANKNRSLYLNRALYSPDILFLRNKEKRLCDVITCAAPNKDAAQKYCAVSDEENYKHLRSRIHFLLEIAETNKVNTLILGAYGCGVFGQDPYEVAKVFHEELTGNFTGFKQIIFAIPKGKDGNLEAFKKVFRDAQN